MRIYDNYTRYMLLFGILILHLLCFSLSAFFIYRFIILKEDYSALGLVAFFFLAPIIVDMLMIKSKFKLIRRMLAKCTISKNGLDFSGIGFGRWTITWNDIKTYGITGFDSKQPYIFIFFSKNYNEKHDTKSVLDINPNRIVFQYRYDIWEELSKNLPEDMIKRLSYSVDKRRDGFYRR